jgi:hypothetical protein
MRIRLTTEVTEEEHRGARSGHDRHTALSLVAVGARVVLLILCVAVLLAAIGSPARACPFCTALKPTLCERRESAAIAALAEFVSADGETKAFRVHQALVGKQQLAGRNELRIAVEWSGKSGALALLFAEGDAKSAFDRLEWSAVGVNETSFAYVARAPSLRTKAAERLAYFIPFLQHADALIADDVYQEFGHAALADVAGIADRLPFDKLRRWLLDREIPQERKGFFGVALGLATTDADRRANLATLESVMDADESDFRAGFDGVLGGYLLLGGEQGLAEVARRYFADAKAAEGDTRHAVSAVRFFYEHDRAIDRERFREALRPLLDRPAFAAAAAIDLARWKDWASLAAVARLYDATDYPQPSTREAVVAFLVACPEDSAVKSLAEIRARDPKGVAAAELKLRPIAAPRQ